MDDIFNATPGVLKTADLADLYDYDAFPIHSSPKGTYRLAYNRQFPGNPSDVEIEMWCAGQRLSVEAGGLGEHGHFKRILQLLYPYLVDEWNYWLDRQLDLLCGPSGTYTLLGGGSLGKSWIAGTLYARLWQACSPLTRGVMIINTTQKMQSERAWKYVIDANNAFPWLAGELTTLGTDPALKIYETKVLQEGHAIASWKPGVGIISQTVKRGASAAATADLKGLHPPELMVIIEEANHLRRTRLERARANWITNKYYKIVLLGNPEIEDLADSDASMEDALYFFSEPVHGYDSIKWGEDFVWENRFGGKSYHFDPYDSPRIREPRRFKVSTWLPDAAYIKTKAKELGGETSQLFQQQIRGIYDHALLPFNPITLSMCRKFDVFRRARFVGVGRERWAAFDPAYSGKDEAFLKIAESGMTDSNKVEIDFLNEETNFVFKLDGRSPVEPSFQMLEWVKKILMEWEVPPENFIMDANVIGIALGDIFTAFLSPRINKINIYGKPSKLPIDIAGQTIAEDRCVNRASEMWIAYQQLIITGQIRGLDDSIVRQLIAMPAENINGKIKVLDKKKFKARYGYSPDRAEACLFLVDMMRERGFKQSYTPPASVTDSSGNPGENKLDLLNQDPWMAPSAGNIFINKMPKPYTHEQPTQGQSGPSAYAQAIQSIFGKH